MIASIEGIVTELLEDSLVINVGGLGFKVFVSPAVLAKNEIHRRIALFTNLIVREDSMTLFGFETIEDRDLFTMILSVSGVGPKTAMAVVSHSSIDTIKKAVINGQPELLGRIPGVGKKTAQNIVLHLQGKIKGDISQVISANAALDNDLISALTSLGYSIVEAQAALQMIPKDTPEDLETRIRIALRYFS